MEKLKRSKNDKTNGEVEEAGPKSTKGYKMVRATRGVVEGVWYFEIRVVKLGESGQHTLGYRFKNTEIVSGEVIFFPLFHCSNPILKFDFLRKKILPFLTGCICCCLWLWKEELT